MENEIEANAIIGECKKAVPNAKFYQHQGQCEA